jgi:hypothetical protein
MTTAHSDDEIATRVRWGTKRAIREGLFDKERMVEAVGGRSVVGPAGAGVDEDGPIIVHR